MSKKDASDLISVGSTHRQLFEDNESTLKEMEHTFTTSEDNILSIIESNAKQVEVLENCGKKNGQEIHADFLKIIKDQSSRSRNSQVVLNSIIKPATSFIVHTLKTINTPLNLEYVSLLQTNAKLESQLTQSKKKFDSQLKILNAARSQASQQNLPKAELKIAEKSLSKQLEAWHAVGTLENQIIANECLLVAYDECLQLLRHDGEFISKLFAKFNYFFINRLICRGPELNLYANKTIREENFGQIGYDAVERQLMRQRSGNETAMRPTADQNEHWMNAQNHTLYGTLTSQDLDINLYFGYNHAELLQKIDQLEEYFGKCTTKWINSLVRFLVVIFNSISLSSQQFPLMNTLLEKNLNDFRNLMDIRFKLKIEVVSLKAFSGCLKQLKPVVIDLEQVPLRSVALSHVINRKLKINSSTNSQFHQTSSLHNYALQVLHAAIVQVQGQMKCPSSLKKISNSKLATFIAGSSKKFPSLDDKDAIGCLVLFIKDSDLMIELLNGAYRAAEKTSNISLEKFAHNLKFSLNAPTKIAVIQLQHILRLVPDDQIAPMASLIDSELNYHDLHEDSPLVQSSGSQPGASTSGGVASSSRVSLVLSRTNSMKSVSYCSTVEQLLLCLKNLPPIL